MTESVEIDDVLGGEIGRLAALRRVSPVQIVRDAVTQYAGRVRARQSFVEEADAP